MSQIAQDFPEEAREREQRLYERFQRTIDERIGQPRLDSKAAEEITAAISLVEQRGRLPPIAKRQSTSRQCVLWN